MGKFRSIIFRTNHLYLTITITVLWILINLWKIIYNSYDLNNSQIVDTSTALQSLLSSFYHKPFINTVPGGSYFSVHASEILYLLLPFFIIYPNFITLYIIQSVVIYSATIPLFLIAKKKLNNDTAAFLISSVYLLNPYIYDNPFETLTLFMGFIIYSYYFFDSKKYILFVITFLISLSTIEFDPIIGAFFGLYLILLFLYEKISIKRILYFLKQLKIKKAKLTFPFNLFKNEYLLIGMLTLILNSTFFVQ